MKKRSKAKQVTPKVAEVVKDAAAPEVKDAKQEAEQKLTEEQLKRLVQHENIITEHLEDSFRIGASLRVIHEEKLYRGDWDDYCSEKWGFSGSHARRLMDAAHCMAVLKEGLSPNGEKVQFPINEAQVRALIEMRKESGKWVKAWQKVLKDTEGKRITAEKIQEVLATKSVKAQAKKAGTAKKDEADEANDAEQKLTRIQTLVKQALKAKKPTVDSLKEALEKIQKALASK